jgi:ribitol-5-phosphate 2-dehydrogenase
MVGQVRPVRNIKDIMEAFDFDIQNPFGKTVMKWEK